MELNSSCKHFVSASLGITHTHIFMHMIFVQTYLCQGVQPYGDQVSIPHTRT